MVDVVKYERGSAASDAAIRVAAFLDLRNKRAEGAQENIASLVNDANCILHLSAANIHTILTELEDLKALHGLTCQAVDKHKATIKTQSAEIERLRAVLRDQVVGWTELLKLEALPERERWGAQETMRSANKALNGGAS